MKLNFFFLLAAICSCRCRTGVGFSTWRPLLCAVWLKSTNDSLCVCVWQYSQLIGTIPAAASLDSVRAAVLPLAWFSQTGGVAFVMRCSCISVQSLQLPLLTVWSPLCRPAVAGHHYNKALVDKVGAGKHNPPHCPVTQPASPPGPCPPPPVSRGGSQFPLLHPHFPHLRLS